MRDIKIIVSNHDGREEEEFWHGLKKQCGDETEILKTIGYLSMWNKENYPFVRIVLMGDDKDGYELQASYSKEENGATGYVIAAIWHGECFGFHS